MTYSCFPCSEFVVFFKLRHSNKRYKNCSKNISFLKIDKLKFMSACSEEFVVLKNNSAAFQVRNVLVVSYKSFSFINEYIVVDLMKKVNTYILQK